MPEKMQHFYKLVAAYVDSSLGLKESIEKDILCLLQFMELYTHTHTHNICISVSIYLSIYLPIYLCYHIVTTTKRQNNERASCFCP